MRHRYPPAPAEWLLAEFVREGLFESWLVEAPQREAYGNHQPWGYVTDLVIAVPAGIDEHSAKWVQLFHRHGELFAQQVNQARYPRRASRDHDSLNVFAARRGAEEVKRLLDFQRQDVGHASQNLLLLLVGNAGQRIASFQPFR